MSLLIKAAWGVWVLGWLSACGFQPMYGDQPQASALSAGIRISAPNDAIGEEFKHKLEDRLNPRGVVPPNPAYDLQVSLTYGASGIGVARDGTVSRYNVMLSSQYTLTRLADKHVVKTGNVQHVGSYNNLSNAYFSTYVSERDAIKRGVVELAELYRQRMAAILINYEN